MVPNIFTLPALLASALRCVRGRKSHSAPHKHGRVHISAALPEEQGSCWRSTEPCACTASCGAEECGYPGFGVERPAIPLRAVVSAAAPFSVRVQSLLQPSCLSDSYKKLEKPPPCTFPGGRPRGRVEEAFSEGCSVSGVLRHPKAGRGLRAEHCSAWGELSGWRGAQAGSAPALAGTRREARSPHEWPRPCEQDELCQAVGGHGGASSTGIDLSFSPPALLSSCFTFLHVLNPTSSLQGEEGGQEARWFAKT